jgi:hypothetical protein
MNTHCICIAVKLQIFFSSRTNGFTIEQLTITETIFLPLDFFLLRAILIRLYVTQTIQ